MATGFPIALPGMRIGLLGGSFDPAHAGHIHISQFAKHCFDLDRVWWMVSPGNPLKHRGPAPMAQRMAAARAMLDDPDIVVTDVEARLGTRMTADTIAALRARCPGVRFVWLMGSDNLVQFDRWDRWEEIARMVPIGVLARPGTRIPARNARAAQIMRRWRLPQSKAAGLALRRAPAWVLINLPMLPHSSSAIRAGRGAAWPEGGGA